MCISKTLSFLHMYRLLYATYGVFIKASNIFLHSKGLSKGAKIQVPKKVEQQTENKTWRERDGKKHAILCNSKSSESDGMSSRINIIQSADKKQNIATLM